MDIFVSGIPLHCSETKIRTLLDPYLSAAGIKHFEVKLFTTKQGKRCGNITVFSAQLAEKFIALHGAQQRNPLGRPVSLWPICVDTRRINFQKSHQTTDPFVLKRLHRKELRNNPPSQQATEKKQKLATVDGIACGFFDYPHDGLLTFFRCYHLKRSGGLAFGRKRLMIFLDSEPESLLRSRIQIDYSSIYAIHDGPRDRTCLTLNLYSPPIFYRDQSPDPDQMTSLTSALLGLDLNLTRPVQRESVRVCSLGDSHAAAAASCYTYVINLKNQAQVKIAMKRLSEQRSAPRVSQAFHHVKDSECNFQRAMSSLVKQLAEAQGLSFAVKFQLQLLVQNGITNPIKVSHLIQPLQQMQRGMDEAKLAEGIRACGSSLPFAGPGANAGSFAVEKIISVIKEKSTSFNKKNSKYRIAKKHDHLALIYKAFVSPATTWLGGPELETKNRVIRKYPSHLDYFLRVNFCDEDGEQVRYEPRVSRNVVFYQRFKDVLSNGIPIAGRRFGFLGFSHSSLRTQTCWFVSPFYYNGSLLLAQNLIQNLGDFSHITSPAKCAARIGQAFSDAADTVSIKDVYTKEIPDVERKGHCFTDGVGTISLDAIRLVWKRFHRTRKAYAPILQIRFQGCKGLLALDATEPNKKICYRPSMNKFPSPDHADLEITGAAYKPLPMYLNRQFVKIMEDLGTDTDAIMNLQTQALAEIETTIGSPMKTANYLEKNMYGTAVGLPPLIRSLHGMGFHFKDDVFLRQVVEISTRVHLRELKHKARIPAPDAHLLFGIVDEVGFLKENEVHVILKEKKGRWRVRTGRVLITRAPAMHPGDFQIVQAVEVPEGSPTEYLHNCVIFSQFGTRSISNMLSGGDLDGDLFNVIFDPALFPSTISEPAEYPRPEPIDIGREVTTDDMSNFFLDFMEQDKLGYICNTHMIIADQKEEGTFDESCITLAEMASVAVDFSKTGKPVDMELFPHHKFKKNYKPDFMANAPHLILKPDATIEFDDDEMEFHDVPDDVDEFLDARHGVRYYESTKILGKLYRNVDETQFLDNMNEAYGVPGGNTDYPGKLLKDLWVVIADKLKHFSWSTEEHATLAKEIRESYEAHLADLMWQYTPHHRQPLSELEVFCGTILGREGGLPSKRTRERNIDMRQLFQRYARETIRWIRDGENPHDKDDDDDDDDNDDDGGVRLPPEYVEEEDEWENFSNAGSTVISFEQEKNAAALQRTIACLANAMFTPAPRHGRGTGPLRSFAYLCAGLCLRLLNRYEQMKRHLQQKENAALGGSSSTVGGRGRTLFGIRN